MIFARPAAAFPQVGKDFPRWSMHKINRWLGVLLAACALFAGGCRQQPTSPSEPALQPAAPAAVQIGGENVLTLTRKSTTSGSKPEFLSVTLLPGRGMNMFQ